jgi:hypothetical protein
LTSADCCIINLSIQGHDSFVKTLTFSRYVDESPRRDASYANQVHLSFNVAGMYMSIGGGHLTSKSRPLDFNPHPSKKSFSGRFQGQVIFRSFSGPSQVLLRSFSGLFRSFQVLHRSSSGPSQVLLRSFSGPSQVLLRTFSGPFQVLFRSFSGPFRSFQVHLRSFQVLSGPFRSFQVLSGPFITPPLKLTLCRCIS